MIKNYLIAIAIEKVNNMSIKELENFLGIFHVKPLIVEPIENYSINEEVEITTHIPGIGHEFVGNRGIIYNIFNITKRIGIMADNNGRDAQTSFVTLEPQYVRKIKNV